MNTGNCRISGKHDANGLDVMLRVELHRFFLQLAAVALVLLLQFLDLRLDHLHLLRRLVLLPREWEEDEAHDDGVAEMMARPHVQL